MRVKLGSSKLSIDRHALARSLGSEDFAWSILDSLPGVAVIAFDTDLRIVALGGQALATRGYQPSQMLGRELAEVLSPASYQRYLPHYLLALEGEDSTLEAGTDDEKLIYVTEFSPIRDEVGAVLAGLAIARDVTESRRAQAKLAASEREFESAFSQAPTGVAMIGLDGCFLRVNTALCEMLGRTAEELVGSTSASYTHPDDLVMTRDAFTHLNESRTPLSVEKRYLRPDGEVVWASAHGQAIAGTDGRPGYIVSHFIDATAIKFAEHRQQSLQASLERLADRDPLTELWNRRRFEEDLRRQLSRCRRYGERAAVLMLDLDGFKTVNDTFGHRTGDDLLQLIAERLRSALRDGDSVARIGGDEFAVILPHVAPENATRVAEKLEAVVVASRLSVDGAEIGVDASIGIQVLDRTVTDHEAVMAGADAAMYCVKATRVALRSPANCSTEP